MLRQVKIYPGGVQDIINLPFWIPVTQCDTADELWIDFHLVNPQESNLDWSLIRAAQKVVIYDIFHACPRLSAYNNWVRKIADCKPLIWITTNPMPMLGVRTVHFDYYWNRTKRAFQDKQLTHKLWAIENYEIYPIHSFPRSRKFLTYHYALNHYRDRLHQVVKMYTGYVNDPRSNNWLEPNVTQIRNQAWHAHNVAPPARSYFDNSYVTCLVESQCEGSNFTVSEKTYDHLIQGRCVLNFAPAGFYDYLAKQGWALPGGIDWSWNLIEDDEERFLSYLQEVTKLLDLNLEDLHKWFMSNMLCWQHNQNMLENKPYDIIDTTGLW
jgi:hypothetical protein